MRERERSHLLCIKVLKPGLDRTVQPKKPQTGHFYGLFNMKNRSMKKKTVNRIDRGQTDWFCEPWLVQTIHTGPLFQALNYTVLDSLPCFFSLYGVIWTLELDHSLKQETLASLSQSRNPRYIPAEVQDSTGMEFGL